MEYVEFLRVRRSLSWHLGILGLLTLAILVFGHHAAINIDDGDSTSRIASGMMVPLMALTPVAMFFAAIYASTAGTSLNREFMVRDLAWTKPIARNALALRYIAVDVAAVALVYVLALLAIVVALARFGVTVVPDAEAFGYIVFGLGVSVMWYALVQVTTCLLPPRGLALAGILWPIALVDIGLCRLSGTTGTIAHVFAIVNPLAYMSGVAFDAHGATEKAIWQMPADERALAVWFFSALFCAVAVTLWPRREA
jgi:hypothetical protein